MPNLINKFIEGGIAGTSHTAGLPNITGDLGFHNGGVYGCISNTSGAINAMSKMSSYGLGSGSSSSNAWAQADFNASLSSSIYGNSQTVQPASLEMTYCIKF